MGDCHQSRYKIYYPPHSILILHSIHIFLNVKWLCLSLTNLYFIDKNFSIIFTKNTHAIDFK